MRKGQKMTEEQKKVLSEKTMGHVGIKYKKYEVEE